MNQYATYRPAEMPARIIGYLVDLLIAGVLAFGGTFMILVGLYFVQAAPSITFTQVLLGVLGGGYYVVSWARWGQTLGQRLVHVHVVRRACPTPGGIGWGPALARLLGYVVCWSFTFSLGFLFDLHDKIAGTQVVQWEWQYGQIQIPREEI